MPFLETSREWLEQSALLLKARPTSTRITTKYSVLKPSSSKIEKKRKRTPSSTTDAAAAAADAGAPTPTLTLKTYDPESGVCLKYRTNRQAEVGRLVASMGMLGRHMAALPEAVADTAALDAMVVDQPTGANTPVQEAAATSKGAEGKGVAGGKKKKKGKK